jgi:hypothetical protein
MDFILLTLIYKLQTQCKNHNLKFYEPDKSVSEGHLQVLIYTHCIPVQITNSVPKDGDSSEMVAASTC